MNLSRDVVKDLVAIYLAGDASPDTRALVDEYLRSDPGLAREVALARNVSLELPATAIPTPASEKQTLDTTRRLLKSRTSTLVVAVLFTLLPLAFAFDGTRVTFVLIRDAPIIGLAWWATAAVMWTSHILIRRRLRVLGL